jgi:hypothetical protein
MFYGETHITGLPIQVRYENGDDVACFSFGGKINRETRTVKIYFAAARLGEPVFAAALARRKISPVLRC